MNEVNGTAIPVKTLQQALGWLQSEQREITVTDAAKECGWAGEPGRVKMGRYLKTWAKQGKIQVADTISGGGSKKLIIPNIPVRPVSTPVQALLWLRTRVHINHTSLMAAIMTILACAALWYGAKINAIYGETLGKDDQSKEIFSAISMIADCVAFFVPSVAACLAAGGMKFESRGAWVAFVFATAWTLQAAFGFASVNLSDTSAVRSKASQQRIELKARISDLEAADKELRKPAKYQSAAKADNLKLEGVQRDLATAREQEAALPAVSEADPQAEKAAKLFGVSPAQIEMVKICAITLLPQLSGLVLMLATGLWRIKEDKPAPIKIRGGANGAAKKKRKVGVG